MTNLRHLSSLGAGDAPLVPMILDCAIDHNDSRIYARADKDHRVYLPNGQKLIYDSETDELKTEGNGEI